MRWEQIPLGLLQTNCYCIHNEKECIIFDPGAGEDYLINWLDERKLKPLAVFLTHAHFDHIGAVDIVRENYSSPVYIHELEAEWLLDPVLNGSQTFFPNQLVRTKPADQIIYDEKIITIGPFTFEVFETPGHSPGSVSYYVKEEGIIISGDTLFNGSIGRTDLPGGDYQQLMKSINEKLLTLPEHTICLPGHGPVTTIAQEKQKNPFLNQ